MAAIWEEERRQREVVHRFDVELRGKKRVEVMACLVGEFGGNGAILWVDRAKALRECSDTLSKKAMAKFLRLLVAENPHLCTGYRCDGSLLSASVRNALPASVVRFLVENGPEALTIKNEDGDLPIHQAFLEVTVQLPQLRILLEANPSTLKVTGRDGKLPLHLACESATYGDRGMRKTLQRMIDAYPGALRVRTPRGLTPVMCALRRLDSRKALHFLQRMVERGGEESLWGRYTGRDGATYYETALRCAVECFPNRRLLLSLIRAWPDALEIRDEHGMLPLHCACLRQGAPELIRLLIEESNAAALEARDNFGRTPIMIDAYAIVIPPTPQRVRLLEEMARLSSQSVRGTIKRFWPFERDKPTTTTVLEMVCEHTPLAESLVLTVMKAWPAALCVSLKGDLDGLGLPQNVASQVTGEARLVFLALVEVLLHETTREVASDPIRHGAAETTRGAVSEATRGRVLQALGRFADVTMLSKDGSFAVVQEIQKCVQGDDFGALRSDVLSDRDVSQTLEAQESLLDMVTGLYLMNKAGRLGPEGRRAPDIAAFSEQQHVQVLESAKDNLSCLFLYLRGCPALFGEP
jgi:hypothetical protein